MVIDNLVMSNQTDLVLSRSDEEQAAHLIHRAYLRLFHWASRLLYHLTSCESFSTIIILVAWAVFISLFLHRCSSKSLPVGRKKSRFKVKKAESNSGYPSAHNKRELKIIELKAETYNGMVKSLRLGRRSIIVLVDQQTKGRLLSDFKNAVWPYRRNRPLQFGYLCLDRNLVWYKTLLERVLGRDNLQVNKKNCIGTVLSLNGFNQYLRIYHAKHHEVGKIGGDNDGADGAFLGFDGNDCDIERGDVHTSLSVTPVDKCPTGLLDKLPDWLEKVFDNSTKRYYVTEWPKEIN